MFADPFTAVMALILLAFIGTLAVFFRIGRELESLRRALGDIRESLQYYAVDAAQQNRDLAVLIRELRGQASKRDGTDRQGEDSLGDLLEKGLPHLAADPLVGRAGRNGKPVLAENAEEEDFLRRFRDVPGNDSSC